MFRGAAPLFSAFQLATVQVIGDAARSHSHADQASAGWYLPPLVLDR